MTLAYISITAVASGRVMKIVISAQYAKGSGVLIQGELGKSAIAGLWFLQMLNLWVSFLHYKTLANHYFMVHS